MTKYGSKLVKTGTFRMVELHNSVASLKYIFITYANMSAKSISKFLLISHVSSHKV